MPPTPACAAGSAPQACGAVPAAGDSITGGSAFSRQVYFGGLQWRTKFSTVPGYQEIPLPAFNGTAAAPSVVDIYVNNVLRLRQAVDTGPFTINNLPVYAGQGNVQMVVRDVLGRQQIYTQSYITGAQLLRRGSKAVSFEIGAPRNRYGNRNSSYGQVFGSGTVRYGVNNSTTVETHGEIMLKRQSFGAGTAIAVSDIGLLSAGLVAGRSEHGNGALQYAQFDRQGGNYAFILRAQTASPRFWQLGLDTDAPTPAPAQQIQAQANVSISERTHLALGYVSQGYRGQETFRAINAGLNFNLRRNGHISIGLLKALSPNGAVSANMIWVVPLERQSAVQLLATAQQGRRSLSAEYLQAAPQEGGWGYRARRTVSGYGGEDVGVNYLGPGGEYIFTANHAKSQNNLQLEARGGIALLGGHVLATRWLDESFAMVEVPVERPIDIYANNIKVGHTGKNGVGFIPRLIPYESNDVYLDDAGLPLSISLDLAPKSIIPGYRTGSLLKLRVQQNRSATLILVDENKKPLVTGIRVHVNGNPAAQEVALRGRVFIPAINYPAAVVVHDAAGARCRFRIAAMPKTEVFPVLGPYVCSREIK